jgi:hypothetical protein
MFSSLDRSAVQWRSSDHVVLLVLAVCALVLAAAATLPSAAGAFGISGFATTPSSTQAAAHPDVTFQFNRTGTESEDLRDMRIDLPPGLLANPESANPKCTDADFNTDKCAANSQVGSLSYKYTVSGFGDVTVPGNMYMLEPGATDVATVGFVLRPPTYCIWFICAVPQKIFQKTSFKLESFDNPNISIQNQDAQRAVTTTIPLVFISPSFTSDVTLKTVKIVAQGKAGKTQTGPSFMAAPSSCAPAKSTATITSYQGVAATAESTYSPTGCDKVPFDPSVEFAPSDTSGGSTSVSVFTLNVPTADAPIQNAAPKSLDITFPVGSAPDFVKLGEWAQKPQCSDADLRANTCPSGSVVGLSAANSDFLPPSLSGGVFITGPVGLTIPLGVRLVGPRGAAVIVRLTLGLRVNSSGANEVFATFDNGPQLPYFKYILGLIPLYVNPQKCGAATTIVKATGWNGAQVTRSTTYDVTNCKAPETTITSGPTGPITTNTATFAFTSSIAGSTFKCKVDSNPEVACDSGTYTTPALPNGPHTFSVYASNGPVPDTTPAVANFTVQQPVGGVTATFTPSTLQAAAHPNLSADVNISGGTAPKSAIVTLPDGFQASLTAAPLCLNAQAIAGTCPAASKIGTALVTATSAGGPLTGSGDVFLTEAPTSADAGGIAIKVPLGTGTFIARGGQYTIKNTNAQQLSIRDIPTAVGSTAISVTRLKLDLNGATNRLLTNASKCSAASSFGLSLTFPDGSVSAPISVPYQSTGCTTVPFNPTVTQSFPATPQAGQATGIIVDVDLPIDNGTLASLTVLEPPAFGPNFTAFGAPSDQCPSSAAVTPTSLFDATSCPASAKIGKMTINTPLLIAPLVGDVYLINKSPLPWFGVKFASNQGITLSLVGVTATPKLNPACDPATDPSGFCQSQISTRFSLLPDTPLTHVKFDLTMPDRAASTGTISSKVLNVITAGDPLCVPSAPGSWSATSHTGATRSGNQTIPIAGC